LPARGARRPEQCRDRVHLRGGARLLPSPRPARGARAHRARRPRRPPRRGPDRILRAHARAMDRQRPPASRSDRGAGPGILRSPPVLHDGREDVVRASHRARVHDPRVQGRAAWPPRLAAPSGDAMTAPAPRTIAELVRARADHVPDALALRFERGGEWLAWSWQTLWRRSSAAAAMLHDRGIRPRDHVLMVVPDPLDAVPMLLGVWRLGAVPIQIGLPYRLASVGAFVEQLGTTAHRLQSDVVLVSAELAAVAPPSPALRVVPVGCPTDDEDTERGLPDVDPAAAPALLQLTSGSTGYPRGVVIPHDRLLEHMAAMSAALPSHDRSIAVSWLPLHHDMGLIGGLLFPLYNGFPGHMISPAAFRRRPL